jgi:hypothetical protein
MKQRHVAICMLALLLVTALASTGMSTETEKQSEEIDGVRLRIIPIHWGADIFDVAPLPNSAGWRAGYKCSVFGLLWTYFAVWDCNPVAYSDAGYDPSREYAQWISRNYSMDDAKRGFWNEHGRWFLFGFLVLGVAGSISEALEKKGPSTPKQPTFRRPVIAPGRPLPQQIFQQPANLPSEPISDLGMKWLAAVKVLGRVKGTKYNLGALLRDCKHDAISLEGNTLVSRFANRANFERIQQEMTNPESRMKVAEAVTAAFGTVYEIRFTSPWEVDGTIEVPLVKVASSTFAGMTSKSTRLDSIGLSARVLNCLERQGITQVREVNEMSDGELLAIKYFGQAGLAELRNKVSRLQVDSNE